MASITLSVNGQSKSIESDPQRTLLEVLREDLDLTGTKYGCGEGSCRACTVLLDGKPIPSCQVAIGKLEGKSIQTIEGLTEGDALHPVQEAFIAEGAMQCGYCVPGMVLTTVALLREIPHPTRPQIVDALDGNLCRCNNYLNIIRAVEHAAGAFQGAAK